MFIKTAHQQVKKSNSCEFIKWAISSRSFHFLCEPFRSAGRMGPLLRWWFSLKNMNCIRGGITFINKAVLQSIFPTIASLCYRSNRTKALNWSFYHHGSSGIEVIYFFAWRSYSTLSELRCCVNGEFFIVAPIAKLTTWQQQCVYVQSSLLCCDLPVGFLWGLS